MSKRYKQKRRLRYHVVRGTFDIPCWCGEPHPYFEPMHGGCGGQGIVNCFCGGDFCVCHNHGEIDCDGCPDCEDEDEDDERGSYLDEVTQEEYWNRIL